MKFTVDRDQLFGTLQRVQSVVEKKNTVQILANILCIVEKDRLSLCATDLEVGVKATLPLKLGQEGKITLAAKHFIDIVKELPSKPLTITRKNNDWVEIVSGKSRFNVVSLPAEEYPSLPDFEDKNYEQAKISELSDMINKTAYAVSTDATRYHLNGVFFEPIEKGMMRMTATDGHRLSYIDQEVFLKRPDFKRGVIIPKKGLHELKRLIDQQESEEESIGLAFDQGYCFAKLSDHFLFVRLIEGEYPDYKQVIPKSVDHTAKMSRDSLISALRRVSLLAHEKSRGVKLSLKPGQLMISTSNPDTGEATEEIEIQYDGEPVEIGFNAKYMLDCLPSIQDEELEFRFKDRLSPGVIQGDQSRNHTYIIMPMRI